MANFLRLKELGQGITTALDNQPGEASTFLPSIDLETGVAVRNDR